MESTPPIGNRELLLILLSKLLPITFDFNDMVIEQVLAKKKLKFFWGGTPLRAPRPVVTMKNDPTMTAYDPPFLFHN